MKNILRIVRKLFFTFFVKLIYARSGSFHCNRMCRLTSNTFFKNNVNFNGVKIYGRGAVIFGNNFHSGKNLKIYTQSHNYNSDIIPYGYGYITSDVVIDDNVWIGDDVTIIAPCKIGEGAIIGYGTVVRRDVAPLSILIGNPAVKVSERDKKSYLEAKQSNRFR